MKAATSGRSLKCANSKINPILQAFAASAEVRRHYTLAQALLPDLTPDFVEAKCKDGVVELPSVGHLRLNSSARRGPVVVRLKPKCEVVTPGVKARFFPNTTLQPHLEVLNYLPLAFRLLFWHGDRAVTVSTSSKARSQLLRATKALEQTGVLQIITDVTASICLFRGSTKNSFYDTRAHGAIFVRLSPSHDEFHLIEEIVHQAGHAAFALLLLEPARFLRVPMQLPFRHLTLEPDDDRTVLVALHGLVTEALVVETLRRVYSQTIAEVDRHQVGGRLAFATRKLALDLAAFVGCAEILGPEGLILLKAMANTCQRVLRRHGAMVQRVNLAGQRYVFSRNRYLAANPIQRT